MRSGWDSQLLLMRSNAEITYSTNRTIGYLKCYTFTIIESGWMTMKYNGRHLFLQRDDMFVYSPSFAVKVLSVSDDDFQGLQELILLGLRYQQSPSPRRNESLRLIYSLFLNELGGIEEHSIKEHRFPPRTEEIFLEFMHLLPQHFAEHHDIAFYADRLNITVSYLSRIVKTVSGGRTVIGYINQMLLMEASFLLSQTSLSIAQISDRLHFSEPAAFTRFFQHMRGMTPREFRKGK